MSRLESFIRRLTAQRDILDGLVAPLATVPGAIFEFGLGGGRTYDHLRQRFPGRHVVVFEQVVLDNPLVRVPPEDLMVGDLRDTAAGFATGSAALIHADIETGRADCDAALAAWLPALVARLLVPGGFAACGCALVHADLEVCDLPDGVEPGRYALVQRR